MKSTSFSLARLKYFPVSKTRIVEIVAALFILLFVYTALSKLSDPVKFRSALRQSILISKYADLLVWILPMSELLVSALLLIPKTKLIGLYGSLVLMTSFTLYIGYMIAFDPELPCSCGGILQSMNWTQHLIFNIFFTLLGLGAIAFEKTDKPLNNKSGLSNS